MVKSDESSRDTLASTTHPEVRRFRIDVPEEDLLDLRQQRAYDRLNFLYTEGLGYSIEMGNRPQTLYGLADSPVALAAWMLDHDAYSYEDIAAAFEGSPPVTSVDDRDS